jgi:hypothetical protein
MMDELLSGIDDRVQDLSAAGSFAVSLRSAERHRTVVDLLGPRSRPGRRLIELPRSSEDPRLSLDPMVRAAKPNAVTAGYLLRRTILELTLAMARGRGLVSVATLAVDRGGLYYDAYRRCAGRNPSSWKDLYTLAGFEQNPKVPDVFVATEAICASDDDEGPNEAQLYEELLVMKTGPRRDWQALPRLDMPRLVERVIPHIVDSPTPEEVDFLTRELEELYLGNEYEIHSRDDRVCAKTFSRPVTLRTLSSLEAFSFEMVNTAARENAEVDIISETGDWLLNRKDEFGPHLDDAGGIRLIVAFLRDVPTLMEAFPGVRIRYQQPWHHNRHMVITRHAEQPGSALYFARHHRTPYVTPVLVRTRRDIELLKTTFDNRWDNSVAVTDSA